MDAPEEYIKLSKLPARYGVASITINEWLKDPELDFPEVLEIRGRKYVSIPKLRAFEARNTLKTAKAA